MDIKISLEIGLSPALEGFLTRFLGKPSAPERPAPRVQETTARIDAEREALIAEGEEALQDQPRQDPQPEAQRRTRRTKAQIEADNAAFSGTDQPADRGGTQESGTSGPPTTGTTATSGASLSDALDAAEPEAREGVTVKADVAAKMQEAMAAASPKKVQDAMAEHLGGAKRLSEIDPSLYGKAIELFDGIIAGA